MGKQRIWVSLSRRRLLGGIGALAGLTALAACGGPGAGEKPAAPAAQPTPAPKPAAAEPTKPAAAAPTTAPAAEPTKPAAAPATAPAAAAKPTPDLKIISGKFNVWFAANWNIVTDEAVGNTFVEWGKQNNVPVEWQSIPGSPLILQKESAALAAGQPPEVVNTNRVYWYSQGEMADLKDLVAKFKDKAGGMYPVAIDSNKAPDGAVIGAPYGIDPWPVHWRIDLIGEKTGGKPFQTWDEVLEKGPSIQTPPRNYLFAFCLGHEGDHVNSIVSCLWSYGGRLAKENGEPDIINPANKAGIEMIVKLWKAKLILPDSFAQTVTSWNNESYQKGRALMTINPATIMGWLLVNDKELAEKTGLAFVPKGPAGSFAEAGGFGFNYFKKAKLADKAPSALEFLMQPENLLKISKSVEGRLVPAYRDHAKGEFWEKSKFAVMREIAEVGRTREWPAPPQPWLAEVTDAKYTLSDMMNKIINENMSIESAQEWAQKEMMESYKKFAKK
jgi:ABC-type glycerol-3-phosphate transport system substrate-binding protein